MASCCDTALSASQSCANEASGTVISDAPPCKRLKIGKQSSGTSETEGMTVTDPVRVEHNVNLMVKALNTFHESCADNLNVSKPTWTSRRHAVCLRMARALAEYEQRDEFYTAVCELIAMDVRFLNAIYEIMVDEGFGPANYLLHLDLPALTALVFSGRIETALAAVAGIEVISVDASLVLISHLLCDDISDEITAAELDSLLFVLYEFAVLKTPEHTDIKRMDNAGAKVVHALQMDCGMSIDQACRLAIMSLWHKPPSVSQALFNLHKAVVKQHLDMGLEYAPMSGNVAGNQVHAFVRALDLQPCSHAMCELVLETAAAAVGVGASLASLAESLLLLKQIAGCNDLVNAVSPDQDEDQDPHTENGTVTGTATATAAKDRLALRRLLGKVASQRFMVQVLRVLEAVVSGGPRFTAGAKGLLEMIPVVMHWHYFQSVLSDCLETVNASVNADLRLARMILGVRTSVAQSPPVSIADIADVDVLISVP
jgi:hypothetical protein